MLSALLRYRPWLMLVAVATWVASFCLPLATGLVNRAVFDELQGTSADRALLWALFGALLAIAVLDPVLMTLWHWCHTTFEGTVETLVRANFFDWVLDRSGRRGPRPVPARLAVHAREDVPAHTDQVNEWYRLSGEGLFAVLALVVMARIDLLVTVLTVLPLGAVVLGTHTLRARLPRLSDEAREATAASTTLLTDSFDAVQEIRTAGASRAVVRRFAEFNAARRRAEVRVAVTNRSIDSVTDSVVLAGRGVILLAAAGAMLEGRFTVGDFVLFTTYLEWMLDLPRRVGRLLAQRKSAAKAVQRIAATMAGDPVSGLVRHRPAWSAEPAPAPIDPGEFAELAVTGLSYRHPDSGRGIAGVDLRLRRGTVTVVTGPVGSGKSTLLEVLLGLRIPDSGEVRWNGVPVPVEELGALMRPPRVAYKPQLPWLFGATLQENVLLGAQPDALEAALHRSALDADLARMPDGLDTLVGSRGVRLSGGQLQRAGAARMFVREPELYVIDDLSSALDGETEAAVWARLDEHRATHAATYLIVTHRTAAIRRADQVLHLHEGKQAPTPKAT